MTEENKTTDAPVPGSPDYPLHSELTIGAYLKQQVAIDPDHEFVVYPDRDLRWTYKDFDERTDALAKGLLAIGMKPGDHLGVWARNIPDWLTFMYACAKIGVVMVTVNPVYKSHELDYVLKQSDMKALCVIDAYRDVDYLQIIRDLVPESLTQERGHLDSKNYPCLKNLIYMGPEKHRGFYSVPELILLGRYVDEDAIAKAEEKFDNNDVVMMQYTSGTTGFPKGVMLTHRNILNDGFYIGEGQKLTPLDRVTLPVPFFHCFGCVLGVMACLTHRSTMIIVEEFDASLVLQAIHKERATAVYGVPTMFIAELNHPDFDSFDLSSLRTGIMAGSPCPPETMREVMERMNMRDVTICYGLTETSPVFTQTSVDDDIPHKCETVGRAHPPVEVRVLDVNDRSLRSIVTGLGPSTNGITEESGFDITPASEIMAILCLAKDIDDLKRRIENIILGFRFDGCPFTVKELGVAGAITVLLKDAINPNLVQTTEGSAAFVHGGPFANIAHGCNSILATKMAMTFGDYVVTEAGFGADLGAEKFYNIKCRKSGLQPKLTVIVATAQGLKMHGGVSLDRIKEPNMEGLQQGFGNLDKHIRNLRSFGQTVLVAFNRFASDTDEEVETIRRHCEEKLGVGFAVNNAFAEGGEGAVELANLVVDTIEKKPSEPLNFSYSENDSVEQKIEKIACNLYGASVVTYSIHSRKIIKLIEKMGIGHYPVCIAKTQYSFSADPKIYGAVNNFEFHIKDIVINNGAEMIVAIAGEILRMPGLPKEPQAMHIDIVDGNIEGLS